MRYRNFKFSEGLFDAGNAAPTFNFKMTDFYQHDLENSWKIIKVYHGIIENDMRSIEHGFIKNHEKKLRLIALNAVQRKHEQFFPDETLETIVHLCSERFEHSKVGDSDKRKPHQRGIAYSIQNALAARRCEYDQNGKPVIVEYATPIEFLNMICNTIAQNILRRLYDLEEPLAKMLVSSYLGDSMPLTISADMILAYHISGIAPTNDALKLQARRNPDFWQPETLQQALKKIVSGDTDPQLTTLLISGEYHRNRMWFGEETAEAVVKETISTIDTSETIKKVSR
jgi:hypothetical protein